VDADGEYHPTVRAVGALVAHGAREVRVGGAQLFAGAGEELLRERGSGLPAAVRVALDGGGVAVLLGADYPVHAAFWRDLLALAGAHPRLRLNADRPGVAAVPVAADAEAALVAVNVAPYDVAFTPEFDGVPLAAEPVVLGPRGHRILTMPAGAGAAPTTHRTETHA
jgi:beta-galactosidase